MELIEKNLWILGGVFVSWVMMVSLWAGMQLKSRLLKILAFVYFVHLGIFSILSIPGVLIGSIIGYLILHVGVRKNLLPNFQSIRTEIIVLGSSLFCLLQPLLILVHDPEDVLYLFRNNTLYLIEFCVIFTAISMIGYYLRRVFRFEWIGIGIISLFFLLFINAFVCIPLIAAFLFGYFINRHKDLQTFRTNRLLILIFVNSVLVCTYYFLMSFYLLEGRGVYYPTDEGALIMSALSTPFIFGHGMLLYAIVGNKCLINTKGS